MPREQTIQNLYKYDLIEVQNNLKVVLFISSDFNKQLTLKLRGPRPIGGATIIMVLSDFWRPYLCVAPYRRQKPPERLDRWVELSRN